MSEQEQEAAQHLAEDEVVGGGIGYGWVSVLQNFTFKLNKTTKSKIFIK